MDGDLLLGDIGAGINFRPGTFDGAISISVLQWLCNAETSDQLPSKRLHRFFETLFSSLRRGARAVFQFYPENDHQAAFIMNVASKCGFMGGLVVDYPESQKKRKFYLCLQVGVYTALPAGITDAPEAKDRANKKNSVKSGKINKEWILKKKEKRRQRGFEVPRDSKYTGRKRKPKF